MRTWSDYSSWISRRDPVSEDPRCPPTPWRTAWVASARFRLAFPQGVYQNLLEDLRSPKRAELIIEPLTLDEINRIFSGMNPATALGGRNTALVSLMLDCGLRVSEEANLKEDDLHRDSRYLKVMGKGSKERMISFGVSCQKALLQYYHYFRPEPAHPGVDTFFLSIDGYPMTASSIQSVIKRLAKASGVPRMYPHLLRHTYATMYLHNGGDVFTLQQNLGSDGNSGHQTFQAASNPA